MNILYLGDIMGDPGMAIVERELPKLRSVHKIQLVVAQAENVTQGKGMLPADMKRLQKAGVDFFTGGNWTPNLKELHDLLKDPSQPVIGPANMTDSPGPGYKYFSTPAGKVLVVSILGQIVGSRQYEITNPLKAIDKILAAAEGQVATIVNFHGDFSSEKVIFGHYLDGRVSLVVGDHWHVATADAMVLPKGTAYVTDVGMCGTLYSSLGVSFDSVIPRWRDEIQTRNELATEPPFQINGVLVSINKSGLAESIQSIRLVI